jgi:MFS transporter, PAT family, beta-lactamase induction signal transducer AmpG
VSEQYGGWRGLRRAFAQKAALSMFFLGFGSGLPFLLVGATLSAWQREAGFSLQAIGLLSAAGSLYLLKFLWAPLVDAIHLPFLSRRRAWLALTQSMVALALLLMALLDPKNAPLLFVLITLLVSFWGATQDIVVDAYRLEIVPLSDQAAIGATYTFGYRIALISAGAGALYMAEFFSWRSAYVLMSALMLIPLLATLLADEPAAPAERKHAQEGSLRRFDSIMIQPFRQFFAARGLAVGLAILLFVGFYKFPDQVIGALANPFYLDSGYSKADIATVSKVFGVWIGIAGAFLGGAGAAIFGVRPMLLVGLIAVALSNLAFVLMAQFPSQLWAFYAAILADNLSQGFGGVVLVAFIASVVQREHTASQFALIASMAFLPGKVAGFASGYMVAALGYKGFFIFSALTALPALLLLIWLWRQAIDKPALAQEAN